MSMSAEPVKQKGWFGRNWLWFVPVGCGLPLLCCCGGGFGFFYSIVTGLKSSEVYVQALDKAKNDPRVKQALGEPITAGFMVSGEVNVNNADSNAKMDFPISGPNGSGTVNLVANKRAGGPWQYSTLEVTIDKTKERINLLP